MRRMWAAAAAVLVCAAMLCWGPLAAAEEDAALAGYRVQIPLTKQLTRLDDISSGKTEDLVALADGAYTLALTPLKANQEVWVRAVLTKGDGFFGLCVLGSRSELETVSTLTAEIMIYSEHCAVTFYAVPGERLLAEMELPLALEGEYRLLPTAQSQGITITQLDALPVAGQPEGTPADPVQPSVPARQEVYRLSPGVYALALLCFAAVLAALIFGQIYRRQIMAFLLRAKAWTLQLVHRVAGLFAKEEHAEPERDPALARLMESTQEIPRVIEGDHLPGLWVTDEAGGPLVKQVVMREAWETAEESAPQEVPARVNAYFLERTLLPAQCRFLTVGLCNRDALQQLGGDAVRALFAPNPKGQIFSREEETGGLYLHVDYFAAPSFVVQPVLRSVCLESVFALEDKRGTRLRLEQVLGHAILHIDPAQTMRTDAGYIVTQKGRLIIGDN